MSSKLTSPSQWSNRIFFIMAATGAAVGLGNIWKFPYMAGTHGGSAFVLVYLLGLLLIGVPVMIGELMLGKISRCDLTTGTRELTKNTKWTILGRTLGPLGSCTLFLVFSFYSVVASWSLSYLLKTLKGDLQGMSPGQIQTIWQLHLDSPVIQTLWTVLFIVITLWISALNIQKGLERINKILMPGLFVILIYLIFLNLYRYGLTSSIKYLFHFSSLELNPSVLLSALGHSFFTLAVGAGAMYTYGSYLPDQEKIGKTVLIIALFDTLVALMAGLAIFPIIFAHGLAPNAGPGLMFISLPTAFAQMPGGQFIGGLFFLLLFFAAWSSSISLTRPITDILQDKYKIGPNKASIYLGIAVFPVSLLCILSFNILSETKIGIFDSFFDLITTLSSDIMLPLGGLLFALLSGRFVKRKVYQKHIGVSDKFLNIWEFLIRWIAPLGIFLIIVQGIIEKFKQ